MILGHLTVTAAGYRFVRKWIWPQPPISLGALLLGAYLPDLLDKPIALATGLSGRGYGHSIVVQAAVFGLLAVLLRRHRVLVAALALGSAIHLLEDWVPLTVLLAPLLGPVPEMPMMPLLQKIVVFYTSGTLQMWIEVLGTAYWILVGMRAWLGRSESEDDASGLVPGPEDPA
jgi:membrane-bound metal-dependent hydrolase YbcI (DUF457 family)